MIFSIEHTHKKARTLAGKNAGFLIVFGLFLRKGRRGIIKKRVFELQLLAEGILIGLATGLIVSALRFLLELAEGFRLRLYADRMGDPFLLYVWFLALFAVAHLLYAVVRKEPLASGSGIPQVKGLLRGRLDAHWLRVLLLKFCGSLLAISAGLSLGQEGPSVQLGASVGQGVAHLRKRRRFREEQCLFMAGAGAGLAAAFNAPLAGVAFCIEELSHRVSAFIILTSIVAAASAVAVSQSFFGMAPAFHFGVLPPVPLDGHYLCFILLALLVGGLGLLFNRALLFSLDAYDRLEMRGASRFMLPLFAAGLLGLVLPEILGNGNVLVDRLFGEGYELRFLLLLLAGKFLFTLFCFGSGAPGGIFIPMLALGAVAGGVYAKAAVFLGWLDPSWEACCIVFGMAAFFSGAVKSPVSSSILIMELTGSFDHMLILLCVSLAASTVVDMADVPALYDALLQRRLRKIKKIDCEIS